MRPLLTGLMAAAACTFGVSACSSSSPRTDDVTATTSTAVVAPTTVVPAPPIKSKSEVTAFLRGPGEQLLHFEAASKASLEKPGFDEAACSAAAKRGLPSVSSLQTMNALIERIPDHGVQEAIGRDLQAKLILFSGCNKMDFGATLANARSSNDTVQAIMRDLKL